MQVSWLDRSFDIVSRDIELADVIKGIRNNSYRGKIEELRKLVSRHGKKHPDAERRKKSLPMFTPSGTFDRKRESKNLKEYSSVIILDIDDLSSPEAVEEIKKYAAQCPFSWVTFVSPTGTGVKILVKVNNSAFDHKKAFNKLRVFYENYLRTEIDTSGQDVTRTCFISFDPNLIENPSPLTFDYQKIPTSRSPVPMTPQDIESTIKFCMKLTSQASSFEDGNRNNFAYRLCCNLNRYGVPKAEAEQTVISQLERSDFTEKEISKAIESAYKNTDQFATRSIQGKKIPATIKSLDRLERIRIYESFGIPTDVTINEKGFIQILLHAHLNDERASLIEFSLNGLGEIIQSFEDTASQVIAEFLLNGNSIADIESNDQMIAEGRHYLTEVIEGKWLPPVEYACRIEVCRFKILKYNEVIRKCALNSRFTAQKTVNGHLNTLAKLNQAREVWLKELNALLYDHGSHIL